MRKYRDYGTQKAAGIILMDILNDDSSAGWAGSYQELEQMKEFLAPFNVTYQDDFNGIWGLREMSRSMSGSNGPVLEMNQIPRAPKTAVVFVDEDEDDLDPMITGLPHMEQMDPSGDFDKEDIE